MCQPSFWKEATRRTIAWTFFVCPFKYWYFLLGSNSPLGTGGVEANGSWRGWILIFWTTGHFLMIRYIVMFVKPYVQPAVFGSWTVHGFALETCSTTLHVDWYEVLVVALVQELVLEGRFCYPFCSLLVAKTMMNPIWTLTVHVDVSSIRHMASSLTFLSIQRSSAEVPIWARACGPRNGVVDLLHGDTSIWRGRGQYWVGKLTVTKTPETFAELRGR